jgi:hypothetical protein
MVTIRILLLFQERLSVLLAPLAIIARLALLLLLVPLAQKENTKMLTTSASMTVLVAVQTAKPLPHQLPAILANQALLSL